MENLKMVGAQLVDQVRKQDAIKSLLLGQEIPLDQIPKIKEFSVMKEFLDLPMDDPKEVALKKIIAAAIVTAAEKGVLPIPMEMSPEAIASLVDEGLTRMKVAYKVANGDLNAIKATEAVINHSMARVVTVVRKLADKLIDQTLPIVADAAVNAVSMVYPQAQLLKPYVRQVLPYVGPMVKQAVHIGINRIAEMAKPVVKSIITSIAAEGKTICSTLKNALLA
ncbi:MAG: hypothetical protein PUD22_08260 [Erysipelotrichaceae bacterium]|nr:hypothetical protein [Erysipelotrichaceae bacterium]